MRRENVGLERHNRGTRKYYGYPQVTNCRVPIYVVRSFGTESEISEVSSDSSNIRGAANSNQASTFAAGATSTEAQRTR